MFREPFGGPHLFLSAESLLLNRRNPYLAHRLGFEERFDSIEGNLEQHAKWKPSSHYRGRSGEQAHRAAVQSAVQPFAVVAYPAQAQLELPAADRRAREPDEEVIWHWKRTRWPQLKKKRSAKGALSSSSMKADLASGLHRVVAAEF